MNPGWSWPLGVQARVCIHHPITLCGTGLGRVGGEALGTQLKFQSQARGGLQGRVSPSLSLLGQARVPTLSLCSLIPKVGLTKPIPSQHSGSLEGGGSKAGMCWVCGGRCRPCSTSQALGPGLLCGE